jgi:hypothetical protein
MSQTTPHAPVEDFTSHFVDASWVKTAEQSHFGQLGGATVFPVPDVVGVQTAGGTTTGDRACSLAVLECAAKPPVETLGRPHRRGRRCGQRHDVIIAARYDKFRLPDPRQDCAVNICQQVKPL